MDIFEVLANNNRVLVMSIPDERLLYTWDKETKLECWYPVDNGSVINFETSELRVKATLVKEGKKPGCFEEAKKLAEAWHYNFR